MQEIIYDIHSKRPLIVGYAGEHNACRVTFRGFKQQRTDSAVHLMISGIGITALIDWVVVIQYAMTKTEGSFEAYLVELTEDNEIINKSNNFEFLVKHSMPLGDIIEKETPEVDYWTIALSTLYHEVERKLADGEFKGDKGDRGDKGEKGDTGADGYTPRKGVDYYTDAEIASIKKEITPKKGVDYFDGEKGDKGDTGARGEQGERGIQGVKGEKGDPYDDTQLRADLKHVVATKDADVTPLTQILLKPFGERKELVEAKDIAPMQTKLNGIEEGAQRNPSLAPYALKTEVTSMGNKKVGYSEVADGKLKMYTDNTKAVLLAELELPTTDLTGYVKDTNFNSGFGIRVDNGYVKGTVDTATSYASKGGACILSKGTLENVLPSKVADNIPSEYVKDTDYATESNCGVIKTNTYYGTKTNKDGLLIGESRQLSRYDVLQPEGFICKGTLENIGDDYVERHTKEKEWVLKGTITTENKDSGITVDLSDCSEMFIKANVIATANTSLYADSDYLIYNAFTTSNRNVFGKWKDDGQFGIECIYAKKSNGESSAGENVSGYCIFYRHIKDLKNIKFGSPSSITSCNVKIYGR